MEKVKREGIKSDKGFTMIELIIVIAIMGILAAILVPSFTQMTRKSRFNADLNTIKHLQTQIELYMAEHDGQFPGLAAGVVPTNGLVLEVPTTGTVAVLADQQYLKPSDVDTATGRLDLQSRKEGAEAIYSVGTGVDNVALNIDPATGAKLEKIVKNVSARDKKWVLYNKLPVSP